MVELRFMLILCFTWPSFLFIEGRSYKAAVVEYSPKGSVYSETPAELLGVNLAEYERYISEAADQGAADVIVFPEYGLTTLSLSSFSRSKARPFLQQFPAIESNVTGRCDPVVPVEDDQLVFQSLSCFSRRSRIYVVANVGEVVYCQPGSSTPSDGICPDDGAYQYSTDVVFDRQGRLIARYRKTHLFLEPLFQVPLIPDLAVFTSDFGIRFGLLTCFDIMFSEPAVPLYYELGIRHFLFPTAWVDELPFLTAAQIQEGWSRFLGVHLLASGYHLPANGQLGSGVFGPFGPISYTFNPESGSQLIVAQVEDPDSDYTEDVEDGFNQNDKGLDFEVFVAALISSYLEKQFFYIEKIPQPNFAPLIDQENRWIEPHGMLYENITGYPSILLETGVEKSATLCHSDLCCSLNYSSSCSSDCDQLPYYRLVAYSGLRTLGGGMYTVGVQLCGVIACPDDLSIQNCVKPSISNRASLLSFDSFRLSGNFSSAQQVYPSATTGTNLQLLHVGELRLDVTEEGNGLMMVAVEGEKALSDIVAVGLYGRAYELDVNK